MWGSSFVGWHPTRIRRSFLPSFRPPRPFLSHALTHLCFTSLTHSLTQHKISPLTHSLHSFTHSTQDLLHITPLHSSPLHSTHLISTPLHPLHSTHSTPLHSTPLHSLSHSLTHSLRALSPLTHSQHPERSEGPAARVVAAGPPVVAAGPPSLSAVAGAVARASRRGCGAHCRRWAPLTLCKGRRSTQSLQKGASARVVAAGPLALCSGRRSQYPEPPEGAAARVVAGPPAALCVTAIVICKATAIVISIVVLILAGSQKGCLRHALSPLGPLRLCALLPF